MDRLEAMRVFVSVAEHRGFAPAARRLQLSASAVTRLVAALEEHLGTRLMQRTTRSVTLTDAGSRYLERARRILSDVAEAEDAAHVERAVPSGRLLVTAPNVFGRLHVAPLMSAYLSRYAAVSGELSLSDRVFNLVEDGVDAAIRIGQLEDASHVARQVGATRRVVVASGKYLARHKKIRSPADIATHSLAHFSGTGPAHHWQFLHAGEPVRVAIAPRYSTNSADAAIDHALRGGGLTMVLAYQVAAAIRSGKLQVVLANFELPPLPIHVIYPSTRLLSAKVRAFVDLITATCDWRFVDL